MPLSSWVKLDSDRRHKYIKWIDEIAWFPPERAHFVSLNFNLPPLQIIYTDIILLCFIWNLCCTCCAWSGYSFCPGHLKKGKPNYPWIKRQIANKGLNLKFCFFFFYWMQFYWLTWACSSLLAATHYLRQVQVFTVRKTERDKDRILAKETLFDFSCWASSALTRM